jgi:hypothetical protein
MAYATHLKMNSLVTQVNTRIQNNIVAVSGPNTIFIDIGLQYNGKRFCKPANDNDTIGSNNLNVFSNDTQTTIEETDKYNPASTDQEANA